jgi:hypothetical protein
MAVILLSVRSMPIWAQRDTAFWFALPKTQAIGSNYSTTLTLSIFGTTTTTYTLERPALNSPPSLGDTPAPFVCNFWLGGFSMNFNNADSVCPYNTVSDYGYYYHTSTECQGRLVISNENSGSFMLKGSNALGTRFMIPAQWQFPNHSQFPESRNSVEVIATENNTVITVTPSVDLYGGTHPAGVPFNVSLNRGQVYCFAAASQSPEGHLGGSEITSNKPVAVNLTDDAVTPDGAHFDIVGDQLIPEDEAGTDYIVVPAPSAAMNQHNGQNNDYALIYTLENNTEVTVYQSGAPTQYQNLQRGDRRAYHFESFSPAFISSTKPILVFQLTGSHNELAGSMLTPLTCHGSHVINYSGYPPSSGLYTFVKHFVTYICKGEYINGFQSGNYISYSANQPFVLNEELPLDTLTWHTIPGTDLQYARLEQEWTGEPCFFTSNSLGPFYTHVLDYSGNNTAIHGDFSSYIADFPRPSSLAWDTLTMPTSYCPGEDINLSYIAERVENIHVFGPDQQEITEDTLFNVSPGQSGYYIVMGVPMSGCHPFISDTVLLEVFHDTLTHLEAEVCCNKPFQNYGFWISAEQTDSVGRIIHDTLFLQTSHGCDSTVALQLTVVDQPTVEILVPEDDFCDVGEIVLTALSGASEYLWSTGAETPFISAVQSGHYTVTASIGDCFATASADIPPCDLAVYLPNTITPSRSDGLNDCLRLPELLIHKISDFSLSLYDRWGEQVFATDDPHFTWCGEGVHLSDVYVYVLRIKDMNGKPFVYRGTLTVL